MLRDRQRDISMACQPAASVLLSVTPGWGRSALITRTIVLLFKKMQQLARGDPERPRKLEHRRQLRIVSPVLDMTDLNRVHARRLRELLLSPLAGESQLPYVCTERR